MKRACGIAMAGLLGAHGVSNANFEIAMQEFSFTTFEVPAEIVFMKAGEFSDLPLKAVIFEHSFVATGGGFQVDNDGPNSGTVS